MSQPLTVDCPTCGAPVEWKATNLNRPFCSDRCKLIDLGAWAAEKHTIPGEVVETEDQPKPDPDED